MIRDEYPEIILIANQVNRGFARAVNQGLARATGTIFLLLNPDCRVQPGDIDSLVAFMDARPRCGAVSPMLITPQGNPQISYARFPRIVRHLLGISPLGWILPPGIKDSGFSGVPPSISETEEKSVDAPAGSCLLVRKEVFEEIGGMDEDFFTYYEDIDWAYRMAGAGWQRFYVPSVRVIHDMGATWRSQPTDLQLARSYEGKYIYFGKRHGMLGERLVRMTTLGCARLNVFIGVVLQASGLGGNAWKRKTTFNRRLLEAHQKYVSGGFGG